MVFAKMTAILQLLAILASILLVSNATVVKKCQKNDEPFIPDIKLELGNCTDQGRCKLVKGQTYNFKQTFTAIADSDKLCSEATGWVWGYELPVQDAGNPDICKTIKTKAGKKGCPVKKGTQYINERKITIAPSVPQFDIDVQWHIKSNNKTIACFEVPVTIVE